MEDRVGNTPYCRCGDAPWIASAAFAPEESRDARHATAERWGAGALTWTPRVGVGVTVVVARAGGIGLEDGDRRVAGLLSPAIREHLLPAVAALTRSRTDDDDDRATHLPLLTRLVRDAAASDCGNQSPVAAAWRPARLDDA